MISSIKKQFHIVAGIPILKNSLLQPREGSFEELSQEGINSTPLLKNVLKTAIGRYRCKFEIGPAKEESRFKIKSTTRGYKSAQENTDYCRAFIYVTNPNQIIKLSNYFRPSNNSSVLRFDDSFAVPKKGTDLRRIMIKIKLPNGHIAEIQIRHAQMKPAFETSHNAYQKQAAMERRFPNAEERTIDVQRKIDHWYGKRLEANTLGVGKASGLNKIIHDRQFFKINNTPVMVVHEPFTKDKYAVVPHIEGDTPMFVIDNEYLPLILNKDSTAIKITRDLFVEKSQERAKKHLRERGKKHPNPPALKLVAA